MLPGHPPGLGLALTWSAIAVAVLATRPRRDWSGGWRRSAVVVFGAVFAAADQLLGQLVVRYLLPELDLGLLPARFVVATMVTLGTATLLRLSPRRVDDRPPPPPRVQLTGVERQAPLIALNLLFAPSWRSSSVCCSAATTGCCAPPG